MSILKKIPLCLLAGYAASSFAICCVFESGEKITATSPDGTTTSFEVTTKPTSITPDNLKGQMTLHSDKNTSQLRQSDLDALGHKIGDIYTSRGTAKLANPAVSCVPSATAVICTVQFSKK